MRKQRGDLAAQCLHLRQTLGTVAADQVFDCAVTIVSALMRSVSIVSPQALEFLKTQTEDYATRKDERPAALVQYSLVEKSKTKPAEAPQPKKGSVYRQQFILIRSICGCLISLCYFLEGP